jgi:type I restriction enzyme, S subunit
MIAPRVKVRDLAEQIRGVSYGKQEASGSPQEGYLPVLRAGNITDDGLVFDDLVFVPAERVSEKQKVRCYDVVVAASSGSLEVVGKAAPALADFDGGFGAFCKVLRPNAKVHPSYFAQFFKTRGYRQQVSSLASGANINNLRNEHLDDMEIPLPPMAEQQRIGTILDQAEALRAKRRHALSQLDTLTQSLFLDLFGDSAVKPKGWPVRQLNEVVKRGTIITYGIVQAGDEFPGGVPYIRTGDIVKGEIALEGLRHTDPAIAARFLRSRVQAGEIVMSIRATVGTTALVPTILEGANLTQGTARIAPGDGIDRLYLLHFLRAAGTQQWIEQQIKGATFREITLTRLRELPVALPPISLQRQFATQVASVERLKMVQRESLVKLDALFACIQHRAFRGEL